MNLNINRSLRDRGLEILTYRRSIDDSKLNEKKFRFDNVITIFNYELHLNFEFFMVKKNVSLGE